LTMKQKLEALLADLEGAFQQAPIKAKAAELNRQWHYSLLTAPALEEGAPLIVGLNWGADRTFPHEPQTEIRLTAYSSEDRASFARMDGYFTRLFGPDFLNRVCQTNYCFFRSESESQLTEEDLRLCQPLFHRLLEILRPSTVFCFSSKLRDHLLAKAPNTFPERTTITWQAGLRRVSYEVMRGRYGGLFDIVSLPHPNAHIPEAAREQAWRAAFPQLAATA